MFPKKGKKLHRELQQFEHKIAAALRVELGSTNRATKTVMRWTGASERTVKHWFAGTHGPSGKNLIALARHSDAVLTYCLSAANRRPILIGIHLVGVRAKLVDLIEMLSAFE